MSAAVGVGRLYAREPPRESPSNHMASQHKVWGRAGGMHVRGLIMPGGELWHVGANVVPSWRLQKRLLHRLLASWCFGHAFPAEMLVGAAAFVPRQPGGVRGAGDPIGGAKDAIPAPSDSPSTGSRGRHGIESIMGVGRKLKARVVELRCRGCNAPVLVERYFAIGRLSPSTSTPRAGIIAIVG